MTNIPAEVPVSHDDRAEWAREIVLVLDRLPSEEATVVRLVYVQRLQLAQAAATMRVPFCRAAAALMAGLRDVGAAVENAARRTAEH